MAVIIDQSGPMSVTLPGNEREKILNAVKGKLTLADVLDAPGRYAANSRNPSGAAMLNYKISALQPGTQRGFQSTTPGSKNYKAFIDASDTTVGGHKALSSYVNTVNLNGAIQDGIGLMDGGTVTFTVPFNSDPIIVFGDGGLTYDSTLTGSQFQNFSAAFSHSGTTTTGFTASLKISSLAGALTNQSVNFSPSIQTTSTSATLTVPVGATILNGNLTCNFSVYLPAETTATVYIKDGTTILWQHTYYTVSSAKTWTVIQAVTDNSAVNGTAITISSSVSCITATTCTYQTATAATSHTATPSGVGGISWVALATD